MVPACCPLPVAQIEPACQVMTARACLMRTCCPCSSPSHPIPSHRSRSTARTSRARWMCWRRRWCATAMSAPSCHTASGCGPAHRWVPQHGPQRVVRSWHLLACCSGPLLRGMLATHWVPKQDACPVAPCSVTVNTVLLQWESHAGAYSAKKWKTSLRVGASAGAECVAGWGTSVGGI